jgi:hypothetical protein
VDSGQLDSKRTKVLEHTTNPALVSLSGTDGQQGQLFIIGKRYVSKNVGGIQRDNHVSESCRTRPLTFKNNYFMQICCPCCPAVRFSLSFFSYHFCFAAVCLPISPILGGVAVQMAGQLLSMAFVLRCDPFCFEIQTDPTTLPVNFLRFEAPLVKLFAEVIAAPDV